MGEELHCDKIILRKFNLKDVDYGYNSVNDKEVENNVYSRNKCQSKEKR